MSASVTIVSAQPNSKQEGMVYENDFSDRHAFEQLGIISAQYTAAQTATDDADLTDKDGNVRYFKEVLFSIAVAENTNTILRLDTVTVSGSGKKIVFKAPTNGVVYKLFAVVVPYKYKLGY